MRAYSFPSPAQVYFAHGRFSPAYQMWKQAWDEYPLSAVLEYARIACKDFRPVDTSPVHNIVSPNRNSFVPREGGRLPLLSHEYAKPVNRMALLLHRLPACGVILPDYEAFEPHQDAPSPVPAREWPTPLATETLPLDICPGFDRPPPGRSACERYQDD